MLGTDGMIATVCQIPDNDGQTEPVVAAIVSR